MGTYRSVKIRKAPKTESMPPEATRPLYIQRMRTRISRIWLSQEQLINAPRNPADNHALNHLNTRYSGLPRFFGTAIVNCFRTVVASRPANTTSNGPMVSSSFFTVTINGA